MTVATLVRGAPGTYNALVVDSVAGSREGTFDCEHDKVRLAYGSTYFTLIGDSTLGDVLANVVAWLDPRRPKLDDPATFDALLTGLERVRTVRRKNGLPLIEDPAGAHLVVCSRQDVFFWKAAYDPGTQTFVRPSAPTRLSPGQIVCLWGVDTEAHCPFADPGMADPFEGFIGFTRDVNAAVLAQGAALPYPLERFSGVLLPHQPSLPVRRRRPFRSLPEQWAKYHGGAALSLLTDADYLRFETPPEEA